MLDCIRVTFFAMHFNAHQAWRGRRRSGHYLPNNNGSISGVRSRYKQQHSYWYEHNISKISTSISRRKTGTHGASKIICIHIHKHTKFCSLYQKHNFKNNLQNSKETSLDN